MSSDAAIAAEGIGKRYAVGAADPYGRLTETITNAIRHPVTWLRRERTTTFWALRDLDIDVQRGEVVGVVGRNGAGKSTLLKILSRITQPTEGRATLTGRAGSLLEAGTGFHPELTGRENVFLNGAIIGMRRREIERKFADIVEFAEVDRFIDTPVKRYSSGMQMRLGFSVAAHLEPEILLVDEVLAVGDASFQQKCIGKMSEVAGHGRTVLFVSHNMAAVQGLCSRAVLLDHGRKTVDGSVEEVVDRYVEAVRVAHATSLAERTDRRGTGGLRFTSLRGELTCGSPGTIELEYEAERAVRNLEVQVTIRTLRGEPALYVGNDVTGDILTELPTAGRLLCSFERVPLVTGVYSIGLFATANGVIVDWIDDAGELSVADGDFFGSGRTPPPFGNVAVDHRWSAEG